jgi:tRNA (adenine37-N6)-methyltransferase
MHDFIDVMHDFMCVMHDGGHSGIMLIKLMCNQKPVSSAALSAINMNAVGVIHTPFSHAKGTPIQVAASEDTRGVVEVYPEFAEGLKDVADFDRIWLIYLLDRASDARLIVRPYLDTQERGIFATRSPARPNHIGISAVCLLGVEQNRLYVAGVDMLNDTPLLDIKPYVPAFDHFEVARTGWYAGKTVRGAVADDRFEARPTAGRDPLP